MLLDYKIGDNLSFVRNSLTNTRSFTRNKWHLHYCIQNTLKTGNSPPFSHYYRTLTGTNQVLILCTAYTKTRHTRLDFHLSLHFWKVYCHLNHKRAQQTKTTINCNQYLAQGTIYIAWKIWIQWFVVVNVLIEFYYGILWVFAVWCLCDMTWVDWKGSNPKEFTHYFTSTHLMSQIWKYQGDAYAIIIFKLTWNSNPCFSRQ